MGMRRIDSIDKILLYGMGLVLFAFQYQTTFDVVPILISVSVLGLVTYFERLTLHLGIGLAYSVAVVFYPVLACFLPAIVYGLYSKRLGPVWLLLILPVVSMELEQVTYLLLSLLAIGLKVRTLQYEALVKKHTELEDAKRELEHTSRRQNQILLEKQDGELHVATLNERNRIAREIHDHVGHQLSSGLLQVGAMLVKAPENKSLLTLKKTLNLAMDHIRNSVHNLYEASIDLEDQLQNLVADFSFCRVDLTLTLDEVPETKVKYALIAVIKEALSNVMKHSNASLVEVTLVGHPGFYQLVVRDNGDKASIDYGEGIGLKNISQRVEALNGHFNATWDQGFKVFITIPKTSKG